MSKSSIEDYEFESPITEQSNSLTRNIDVVSSRDIVNLFCLTDNQIFEGWQVDENIRTQGLNDETLLENISKLSEIIRNGLNDSNRKFKLILSGCGTSGRLAYICSQSLNEFLKKELATYLMAGDDDALINSIESIEDSPKHGIEGLKQILDQNDHCVLIAITCGLSAPFVAGQLYHYLKNNHDNKLVACGLVGFNTRRMARQIKLIHEHDSFTFTSLLNECLTKDNFFLLNPIIGPEPITGSTRMKSGTSTKIILDLIVSMALIDNFQLREALELHHNAIKGCIYNEEKISEKLASLIEKSSSFLGKSIENSICYLSNDKKTSILCGIDASECVPTFGSEKNQFRGLYFGSKMNNSNDYWSAIDKFDEFFYNDYHKNSKFIKINEDIQVESESISCLLNYYNKFVSLNSSAYLKNDYFRSNLQLTLVKLCLNIISTGTFIKYGKVYFNYMIDVKTSNIKLYLRAINIISLLSNQSKHSSEVCLLKAIYEVDTINEEEMLKEIMISVHVERSTRVKNLVPKALIMCITNCSYEVACKKLDECSSVRVCIDALLRK